jgi:ribosomal protein L29
VITLTGKRKEVMTQLDMASKPDLTGLLTTLAAELNKLYLVHSLGKLKQTSLIKKNRRILAIVRTLLRKKYNAAS